MRKHSDRWTGGHMDRPKRVISQDAVQLTLSDQQNSAITVPNTQAYNLSNQKLEQKVDTY